MAKASVVTKGILAMALAMVVMVGSAACRSGGPPDKTGSISLTLTGTAAGVTYRLRNAQFVITSSANGVVVQVLNSESDPNGALLSTTLAAGAYSINLEPGWTLERVDTAQVVDAMLTSPNPRTFQIVAGGITTLTYDFLTSGGPITVGTGTLDIGISVTVDGGAGTTGCTTTPNSCGAGFVCQQFDLSNGMTEGRCIRTCDPVSQIRSDGALACGSADPANPTLGCYGTNDVFTCVTVPSPAANLRHGDPAFGPASGGAFLNGCAAGYQAYFFASSTDQTPVCSAYCQPTPTFSGNTSGVNGVPPYSCADRGAPPGTECRYLSFTTGVGTPLSNAIGVCFNPSNFGAPSCTMLSSSDTDGNGTPDHLEWGCGPL